MAELMKYITIPCVIDFMAVSSYGSGTESSGRVNIVKDMSTPAENMDILIVEDIIDSGNTLSFMLQYFKAKNCASVEIATLLNKPSRRKRKYRLNIPVKKLMTFLLLALVLTMPNITETFHTQVFLRNLYIQILRNKEQGESYEER